MARNRLKELRLRAGFTQKRLAAFLLIDRNTYVAMEAGLAEIPADCLRRICIFYGIAPDDLYSRPKGVLREDTVFEFPSQGEADEKEDNIPANDGLSEEDEIRLAQIHLLDLFGKGRVFDQMLDQLLQETAAALIIPSGVFETPDEPDYLDQLDREDLLAFAELEKSLEAIDAEDDLEAIDTEDNEDDWVDE